MKRQRSRQLTHQRVALGVLGAVLVALGVLGALMASSTIDRLSPWAVASEPLLNEPLGDALADQEVVFQVAAVAVGVLLVLLGLVWLIRLIPARRHHQDQEFSNSTEVPGNNSVRGGALAGALERDLEAHDDIEEAVAEFLSEENVIRLSVTVFDSTPLEQLLNKVIEPAVARSAIVGEFPERPEVLTDVRFVEPHRTVA